MTPVARINPSESLEASAFILESKVAQEMCPNALLNLIKETGVAIPLEITNDETLIDPHTDGDPLINVLNVLGPRIVEITVCITPVVCDENVSSSRLNAYLFPRRDK